MVLEWIRRHLRFAKIGFGEGVRIDDQDSIGLEVRNVHFKRGGIHDDQDVNCVARRVNFVGRKM